MEATADRVRPGHPPTTPRTADADASSIPSTDRMAIAPTSSTADGPDATSAPDPARPPAQPAERAPGPVAAAESAPESAAVSAAESAPEPSRPRPAIATATGFAEIEHARAAWNRTARAAGEPLADFDLARVRSRNDAAVVDGKASRLITLGPEDEGLAAAVPWTVERLRGPFARLRFAATAGATTGVLPSPILFPPAATVAGTAAAWKSILAALEDAAAPDAVEIGPLPLDSTAWGGLLATMDDDLPFRLAGSRTSGAWIRLPVSPDTAPAWRQRVQREQHRLRRDHGPERAVVLGDLTGVRAELHEADRMLRRTRGGGFSAVPGARALVEGLIRASAADGGGPEPVRPVAIRLEHGERVIGRAIAILAADRAIILAVACTRDQPYRRYAPGRLVFDRLVDELLARGVRTIEGGPAAIWFAARCPDAVSIPLQTVLLVRRSGRGTAVEHMVGALGRVPSLGPFERFVARLRPWATAFAEDAAREDGDLAEDEADARTDADAGGSVDASGQACVNASGEACPGEASGEARPADACVKASGEARPADEAERGPSSRHHRGELEPTERAAGTPSSSGTGADAPPPTAAAADVADPTAPGQPDRAAAAPPPHAGHHQRRDAA